MFWKKWPYWARGGVIGALVLIINFSLVFSCSTIGDSLGCFSFRIPTYLVLFFPGVTSGELGSFWVYIIAILPWILFDSLLGLRYGKIKNRDKK